MWLWGVGFELVQEATHRALTALKDLREDEKGAIDHEPIVGVPIEQIEAIRPFCSPPIWAMIELQRLTGARPGEACDMRTCDLEMKPEGWIYRPASHKTQHHGKLRPIAIGPQAQAVLKPFLRADRARYLFSPVDSLNWYRKNPLPLRTKRRIGERFSADSLGRAISRACAKAKIDSWHPNQLRHHFAEQTTAEFGLEVTRALLGHSHAKTSEIYGGKDLKVAIEVARKIG